jgi:WD40 repeat protein
MLTSRALNRVLLLTIVALSAAGVALGVLVWRQAASGGTETVDLAPGAPGSGFRFVVVTPSPPQPITAANAGTLYVLKSVTSLAAPRLAWGVDEQLLVQGQEAVARFDSRLHGLAIELVPPGTLLAISPDGRTTVRAAQPGAPEARIVVIDTGGEVLRTLPAPGGVTTATFIKGGSAVALTSADRIEVMLWDVAAGTQVGELTGFTTAAPVYGVRLAEDGSRAAWVARATVQFHDVASNTLGATLRFQEFVAASAFTRDGSRFVTSLPDTSTGGAMAGVLQWWDPATGEETARAVDPTGPARALAFSPDGTLLATANEAGVAIWAAGGTTPVMTLDVPEAVDVAFSLDGKLLATSTQRGDVTVWRTR